MADKILNSFDVWIRAQDIKSKLRLRSIDNISLEGINKLRELILQLAVEGKLVPQDLRNESSSFILTKIHAEKKRLIEENRIKRQTELPEISNEERPFSIPEQWSFARLGEVTNYGLTEQVQPNTIDETTWVLELEDIEKITSQLLKKVIAKDRVPRSSKNRFFKGDVLYGKLRPYLDKVIVAGEDGICTTEMIPVRGYSDITPQFLKLVMKSPYFVSYANDSTHGMNLPRLGTDKARMIVIPVVPLKEQHRIVAKVDELMALCDELEQQETNHLKTHQLLVETLLGTLTQAKDAAEFETAWTTLAQHFDDLFITEDSIDQLKQTILQLAVMGKLVKQDPEDEPASVLLEKIKREKERLIDTKEIKKQKPIPAIKENERIFQIPNGWEWCRLSDIGRFTGGGTPSMSRTEYWDGNIPWISPKDMGNEYVSDSEMKITTEGVENSTANLLPPGSLLIVARSGILKRRLPVAINTVECSVNQDIKVLIPYNIEISRFLLLMFSGLEQSILNRYVKIGTTVHSLKYEEFEMMPVAIPPISEQQRIISKVDELMDLCDHWKEKIAESQKVANLMANSILEQVV